MLSSNKNASNLSSGQKQMLAIYIERGRKIHHCGENENIICDRSEFTP